jgi:hypothetical protein
VITLLLWDFLLKLENVLDRYRFPIFANLARLNDALAVELIDEIYESLGFVFFLEM